MKCLQCNTRLKVVTYEGVPVGLCATCKGVLLTEKGLKAIESTQDVEVSRDAIGAVERRPEVGRFCPKCGERMTKAPYSKIASITVDRCDACTCIWLDRGELEAVQALYENYPAKGSGRQPARGAAASPARMTCPKCNLEQLRADECTGCGVIVAKVLAREAATVAAAAPEQDLIGQVLGRSTGFSIDQQAHAFETWTEWEVRNHYGVTVRGTPYQWRAAERAGGLLGTLTRNTGLSQFAPFTVRVFDHQRNHVIDIDRPASVFLAQVDVSDSRGTRIGSIQRQLLSLNNHYRVCATSGRELFSVTARRLLPRTFVVKRTDREVGHVKKRWGGVGRELMTDADHFTLTFPTDLDRRAKLLLLATVFFIDFVHFERRGD